MPATSDLEARSHELFNGAKTNDPDWLDQFTLRMIDNAIEVLRAEVSNV